MCRLRYSARDPTCQNCLGYQTSNGAYRLCPYTHERLNIEALPYGELVERCFRCVKHTHFQNRVRDITHQFPAFGYAGGGHVRRLTKYLEYAGDPTATAITPWDLAAMEIGDAVRRDCQVDELTDGYPVLKCLEITVVNVDELEAAALMAQAHTVPEITEIAKNLDQFDFLPGVRTPEDYGRHMIQESGRFEYDAELDAFYDYEKYGRQRLAQEQGQFSELGYVSYHGELTIDELLRRGPAEQMDQGMGGMA